MGVVCGCGCGMWVWYVGVVCGCGMWVWYVGVVCECGMWVWYVVCPGFDFLKLEPMQFVYQVGL